MNPEILCTCAPRHRHLRTTEIWTSGPDNTPPPTRTRTAVWLSRKGLESAEDASSRPEPGSTMLLPTKPTGSTCGVALVPDASTGQVLLNGVRIGPGMHVLHHADRVALEGQTVWFAIAAAPDEVLYDPEIHGHPVYCHRTKARLEEGDPMVICHGTPKAECGMMFTAAGWNAGIPCHSCGARPGDPGWTPPASERRGSLIELFELVEEG